jgi:hypothetical protein
MNLRRNRLILVGVWLGLAALPARAQVDAARCGGQGQVPCTVCAEAPSLPIADGAASRCERQAVRACDLGLISNPEKTRCEPIPPQGRLVRRFGSDILGNIVTPNPTLWMRPSSSSFEYLVATEQPEDEAEWFSATQFCSLLTLHWLQEIRDSQNVRPSLAFGDLQEAEQLSMVQTLIDFTRADSANVQTERAVSQLQGFSMTDPQKKGEAARQVIDAIRLNQYPPGTLIWAGNDDHVVGFHVRQGGFDLYDSNLGTTTAHATERIRAEVDKRQLNVFVVRLPAGSQPGPSTPSPKPSPPVPDPGGCGGWMGLNCCVTC